MELIFDLQLFDDPPTGDPPSGDPPSGDPPSGEPGGGSSGSDPSWSGKTEITAADTQSNQTYTSTTADENALLISTTATVQITNATVTKSGDSSGEDDCNFYGINSAVMCMGGGTVSIEGGTVNATAKGANGIFSYGGNGGQNGVAGDGTTVYIKGVEITTTGDNGGGIMTTGGGKTVASDLTITTSGQSSAAIRTDRGGGEVEVYGGTYTSNGLGSPAIYSTADILVENATLTSNLSEGVCIEGLNSVTLTNCTLTANNTQTNGQAEFLDAINIYQSMSGDSSEGTGTFTMTGGTLNVKSGHVFHVTNTTAIINLNGVTINNEDSNGVLLSVCDDGWNGADNVATFNATDQTLTGTILVGDDSTLNLNLSGSSTFTGSFSGEIFNNADSLISNSLGTVNVVLADDAKWYLTEDTYINSFTGDAANVISNGFKLYEDGAEVTGTTFSESGVYRSNTVDNTLVSGSAYDDTLTNIGSNVTINALAGNDAIVNDADGVSINAGTGNNTVSNSSGDNVTIVAGDGNNFIAVLSSSNNVTVTSSAGKDTIANSANNALINSGDGDDLIQNVSVVSSVDGDSVSMEGGENVTINAGAGNDSVHNYVKNALVDAGDGDDFILNGFSYSDSSVSFTYNSDESTINAGAGNDSILNGGSSVSIDAGAGNDLIQNSGTNVTVLASAGDDSISGVNSTTNIVATVSSSNVDGDNVILTTSNGTLTIIDGKGVTFNLNGAETVFSGNDSEDDDGTIKNTDTSVAVSGTENDDTITNSGDNVTINADGGNDSISNSGANVLINGGDGDNYIVNGALVNADDSDTTGNSATIISGEGNDSIWNYGESASINAGNGDNYISAAFEYTRTGEPPETVGPNTNITAGDGDDTIYTTRVDGSLFDAGEGDNYIEIDHSYNNTIQTGSGNDTLVVKRGSSVTAYTGDGDDLIAGDFALVDNDWTFGRYATIDAGNGNDMIFTYYANLASINGGAGNDSIIHNGKDTTIDGGAGDDLIMLTNLRKYDEGEFESVLVIAGEGNDTLQYLKFDDETSYNSSYSTVGAASTTSIQGAFTSSSVSGDNVILTGDNGSLTIVNGKGVNFNINGTDSVIGGSSENETLATLGQAFAILTMKKDETLGYPLGTQAAHSDELENSPAPTNYFSSETWTTTSADNLKLNAVHYSPNEPTGKWVILVHPYSYSGSAMNPFATAYLAQNFDVLVIDQRAAGKSEGDWLTMGVAESADLAIWTQEVKKTNDNAQIVLHGVSMGAATVLLGAALSQTTNVAAVIEDCAYSDIGKIFGAIVDEAFEVMGITLDVDNDELFNAVADAAESLNGGYDPKEAAPIDVMANVTVPSLFIHGTADTLIPVSTVQELYDASGATTKVLLTVEGAGHAMSAAVDSVTYLSTAMGLIADATTEIGALITSEENDKLVRGTIYNDTISNSGSNVSISGGAGDDLITNSARNVSIIAGAGNDTVSGVNSRTNIIADVTADTVSDTDVILTTNEGTITLANAAGQRFLLNGESIRYGGNDLDTTILAGESTVIGGIKYTAIDNDAVLNTDSDGAVVGISSGKVEATIDGATTTPTITVDGSTGFDFTATLSSSDAIEFAVEEFKIAYVSGNVTYSAEKFVAPQGEVVVRATDAATNLVVGNVAINVPAEGITIEWTDDPEIPLSFSEALTATFSGGMLSGTASLQGSLILDAINKKLTINQNATFKADNIQISGTERTIDFSFQSLVDGSMLAIEGENLNRTLAIKDGSMFRVSGTSLGMDGAIAVSGGDISLNLLSLLTQEGTSSITISEGTVFAFIPSAENASPIAVRASKDSTITIEASNNVFTITSSNDNGLSMAMDENGYLRVNFVGSVIFDSTNRTISSTVGETLNFILTDTSGETHTVPLTTESGSATFHMTTNRIVFSENSKFTADVEGYKFEISTTDAAGGTFSSADNKFTFTPDTGDGTLNIKVSKDGIESSTLNLDFKSGSFSVDRNNNISLDAGTELVVGIENSYSIDLKTNATAGGNITLLNEGIQYTPNADDGTLSISLLKDGETVTSNEIDFKSGSVIFGTDGTFKLGANTEVVVKLDDTNSFDIKTSDAAGSKIELTEDGKIKFTPAENDGTLTITQLVNGTATATREIDFKSGSITIDKDNNITLAENTEIVSKLNDNNSIDIKTNGAAGGKFEFTADGGIKFTPAENDGTLTVSLLRDGTSIFTSEIECKSGSFTIDKDNNITIAENTELVVKLDDTHSIDLKTNGAAGGKLEFTADGKTKFTPAENDGTLTITQLVNGTAVTSSEIDFKSGAITIDNENNITLDANTEFVVKLDDTRSFNVKTSEAAGGKFELTEEGKFKFTPAENDGALTVSLVIGDVAVATGEFDFKSGAIIFDKENNITLDANTEFVVKLDDTHSFNIKTTEAAGGKLEFTAEGIKFTPDAGDGAITVTQLVNDTAIASTELDFKSGAIILGIGGVVSLDAGTEVIAKLDDTYSADVKTSETAGGKVELVDNGIKFTPQEGGDSPLAITLLKNGETVLASEIDFQKGAFTLGSGGTINFDADTEAVIKFSDTYSINLKTTGAAGGTMSLTDEGIQFKPNTDDGKLEISVNNGDTTRTATAELTGAVTIDLNGNISLAKDSVNTVAFEDGTVLKLTAKDDQKGVVSFNAETGLNITDENNNLELEFTLPSGAVLNIPSITGTISYQNAKVTLYEGTTLRMLSGVDTEQIATVESGTAVLDFSEMGSDPEMSYLSYSISDNGRFVDKTLNVDKAFILNKGTLKQGTNSQVLLPGVVIYGAAGDSGVGATTFSLDGDGEYTVNGFKVNVSNIDLHDKSHYGTAIRLIDNKEISFVPGTATISYDGTDYTGDYLIHIAEDAVSMVLYQAGTETFLGTTFTLTEDVEGGMTISGEKDNFSVSHTITEEEVKALDETEDYIGKVFSENIKVANDSSYTVTLSHEGLKSLNNISSGATVNATGTMDGENYGSFVVVNLDTSGNFTFGTNTVTVSSDNISSDNYTALSIDFGVLGDGLVYEINNLDGSFAGKVASELTVNSTTVTMSAVPDSVSIVSFDGTALIGGFSDAVAITADKNNVGISTTGKEVTFNGVTYSVNANADGIIVADNEVVGLNANERLTISKAGKYNVNNTELNVKAGDTIIGVTNDYAYIYDPSTPDFNSSTSTAEILTQLGIDNEDVVEVTEQDSVNLTDEGKKAAVVKESATGDKTISLDEKGSAAIVEDTSAPVTVAGGVGNDTLVSKGDNVLFDMTSGGKDQVVATGGNVSLQNYDPYTSAGIQVTPEDLEAGVKLSDGQVQLANAKVNIGSTADNFVNLFMPDGDEVKVGFASADDKSVNASTMTDDVVLMGGGSYRGISLANTVGGSELNGGKGNDSIFGGAGDTINAGAGNNYVEMSDKGGSLLNFNEGKTTVEGFNFVDGDNTADSLQTGALALKEVKVSDGNVVLKTNNGNVTLNNAENKVISFTNDYTNGDINLVAGKDELDITENGYYISTGNNAEVKLSGYTGETAEVDLNNNDYTDKAHLSFYGSVKDVDASGYKGTAVINANDKNNVITAADSDTTMNGGAGNDTFVGGAGSDEFIVGSGRNVVKNFDTASDKVNTEDAVLEKVGVKGDNVVLTLDNGTTTIEDVVGKQFKFENVYTNGEINLEVASKELNVTGDGYYLASGRNATVSLANYSGNSSVANLEDSNFQNGGLSFYGDIRALDASGSNKDMALYGNTNSNVITAGSGGNTLWGGAGGNDTLIGGDGEDVFLYGKNNGKDVVQGATSADLVRLTDVTFNDLTAIGTDLFSGNDIKFTLKDSSGGGSLTIKDGKSSGVAVEIEGHQYAVNSNGAWELKS